MTKSIIFLYIKIDKQTKEDNSVIGKTYNIVYNLASMELSFQNKISKKNRHIVN